MTKQELQKLTKIFQNDLILKTQNFQPKLDNTHIIEKKNSIDISVSGYENKEKKASNLCINKIL